MRYKSTTMLDPFSSGRGPEMQLTIRSPHYDESYFVTDYFYSCIWETDISCFDYSQMNSLY